MVVAAGWLLRVWPALRFGDWWRVPVDYDDAVYFVSSALLWRGEVPYRDFVLVHPPGLLLFLAPVTALTSALGPADAFSLARGLTTLVGAVNIALSARVAHRAAGPVAALVAALVYAVSPEAVLHERSTYLEPPLNLACLLLANAWLDDRVERRPRAFLISGLFLGWALAIKSWGVVWVVGCLLSAPSRDSDRDQYYPDGDRWPWLRALGWLALGVAVTAAVVVGPFLLLAPRELLAQTVTFQLTRPPDGMAVGFERLGAMLGGVRPVVALAILGLAAGLARPTHAQRRSALFFGAAWVATVIAFTISPSYWPDYNAHLAPAQAHLAGLGAAFLWRRSTVDAGTMAATRWRRVAPWAGNRRPHPGPGARTLQGLPAPRRFPAWLAAALAIVVVAAPLRRSIREANIGGDLMERVGARVSALPADACYIPFEPVLALAGDRLPSVRPGRQPIVDVYGSMLIAGQRRRGDHGHAVAQIRSRPAQAAIRSALARCEFLSLGPRGETQLTPFTRRWIERRWELLDTPDRDAVDLWRLRR